MENSIKTDEIYEVKFEQLVETEKQPLSAVNDIMEGLMDVSVSMGSTKEKIGRIVNYKIGDVIVLDKPVEEALDITNSTVAEALDGLPPVKMHCSNLAQQAVKAAIDDYKKRNGKK